MTFLKGEVAREAVGDLCNQAPVAVERGGRTTEVLDEFEPRVEQLAEPLMTTGVDAALIDLGDERGERALALHAWSP